MVFSSKEVEAKVKDFKERLQVMSDSLNIDSKENDFATVEKELQNPEVWNNSEKMATLNKKKRILGNDLYIFRELKKHMEDLNVVRELISEGEEMDEELVSEIESVENLFSKLEFQKMLGGKMDPNNAIVYLNAGAGGRESQDWAVMLSRMYMRWGERRNLEVEIVDKVSGDDAAGIKSITIIFKGAYAYGYLKAECGVHRLVRISPFDSNKRRHTSFASVFVTPEVDDDVDIEIDDKDLKIDTFRSGGAGGQHVNTTDSAVRITHLPSNIAVVCQSERSQHKNKATAMKILRSKLYEAEMKRKKEGIAEQEKHKMGIDFGSQIRSYVLHPYKMVKDHRTSYETGNAEAVLDGEQILDQFMEDYLLKTGGNDD